MLAAWLAVRAQLSKQHPTSQDMLIKTDNTQVILALQQQLSAAELTIKTMREAAQALIDRWNSPSWKAHTADFIHALEKAIQPA